MLSSVLHVTCSTGRLQRTVCSVLLLFHNAPAFHFGIINVKHSFLCGRFIVTYYDTITTIRNKPIIFVFVFPRFFFHLGKG